MNVMLRSDDLPDVAITANEYCNLQKLDQHIRTLLTARRWLKKERELKRARDLAAKKTDTATK